MRHPHPDDHDQDGDVEPEQVSLPPTGDAMLEIFRAQYGFATAEDFILHLIPSEHRKDQDHRPPELGLN